LKSITCELIDDQGAEEDSTDAAVLPYNDGDGLPDPDEIMVQDILEVTHPDGHGLHDDCEDNEQPSVLIEWQIPPVRSSISYLV
jgi:hypothetical protein